MRLRPGHRVGRYEILAALGAGGMGEVYRARDTKLNRDVALKFVGAPDRDTAASLSLTEARAAAALSHPNLCTLFEVEHHDREPFIVMELIDGRPLAEIIGERGLAEGEVLRLGSQIASGVAHAHERHIVHRDLKSGNVMVTRDGRAKVLDFGIARQVAGPEIEQATTAAYSMDGAGNLAGTLPYMSPELLRGESPTPRSDVWALGVVLYEMATGRRPFDARTSVDLTSAILREPVPAMSAGPGLVSIVQRCLQKEPGARFADAGQVAAALETLDADPVHPRARPVGRGAMGRRWMAAVPILALALAGLAWWQLRAPPPAPEAPIRSLAVLPLTDLSTSGGEDYFVDGITDAIIGEVGQLLSVISRTSVMQYKGTAKSIPQIGTELNVDAVLEGSVLRAGSRIRVTTQLVQARTALSLWTSSFDRDVGDIIALQRDIARTVASALSVRLTPQQRERLASPSPVAPAAVEAYLRGRHEWNRRTPESLRSAIALFEEAIGHDPGYAAPHAGLASSYVLLGGLAISDMRAADSLPRARDEALEALKLDPNLAEGHAALAYTRLYQWNLPGSEAAFERAIAINPSYATARFWYGARLAAEGRFAEAIDQAERARLLDPASPIITAGVSWMNHFARRHDRAAALAQATLTLEPDFVIGLARLGTAFKHLGDFTQALANIERAVALSKSGPDHLAQLGQIYARQGRHADARRTLERLTALARTRYVPAYDFALVHASLGELDEAFAWLGRAFDERYGPLVFLGVDPDIDALRADPRLAAIADEVKQVGREAR
jgi:serine/threonine-protein kinase